MEALITYERHTDDDVHRTPPKVRVNQYPSQFLQFNFLPRLLGWKFTIYVVWPLQLDLRCPPIRRIECMTRLNDCKSKEILDED